MDCKNMKLLIIATTYFELDGITNVILNYFRAMDQSDMTIDFVIPNDISNDLRLELESYGSSIYIIRNRQKRLFAYINKLAQLIEENNYDIVHAHGNSCTLGIEMVAAKRGKAKVRISHSHNSQNKYLIAHKMLRGIFDANYTHALACGEKAGKWLFQDKDFEIINNGIDISKFMFNLENRQTYREKYNLTDKKVMGHIGHFSYQKNHDYLVDIFNACYKEDNNYRLMLIGEGDLRASVANKVNDLGLSDVVIFTGKTFEVPQILQALDVFVMPSRFEGFPLTLVEAQTACLPCFVSDAVTKESGITELVHFVSLEKSPGEWVKSIQEAPTVNREKEKDKMCQTIIDAGYSISDNAKNLKALYQSYCNAL